MWGGGEGEGMDVGWGQDCVVVSELGGEGLCRGWWILGSDMWNLGEGVGGEGNEGEGEWVRRDRGYGLHVVVVLSTVASKGKGDMVGVGMTRGDRVHGMDEGNGSMVWVKGYGKLIDVLCGDLIWGEREEELEEGWRSARHRDGGKTLGQRVRNTEGGTRAGQLHMDTHFLQVAVLRQLLRAGGGVGMGVVWGGIARIPVFKKEERVSQTVITAIRPQNHRSQLSIGGGWLVLVIPVCSGCKHRHQNPKENQWQETRLAYMEESIVE
ncbi:hypothetical protein Tco_0052069 [Tanacetum coccineum]